MAGIDRALRADIGGTNAHFARPGRGGIGPIDFEANAAVAP